MSISPLSPPRPGPAGASTRPASASRRSPRPAPPTGWPLVVGPRRRVVHRSSSSTRSRPTGLFAPWRYRSSVSTRRHPWWGCSIVAKRSTPSVSSASAPAPARRQRASSRWNPLTRLSFPPPACPPTPLSQRSTSHSMSRTTERRTSRRCLRTRRPVLRKRRPRFREPLPVHRSAPRRSQHPSLCDYRRSVRPSAASPNRLPLRRLGKFRR